MPTNEVAPGNNFNNHLDLSFGMLGFTERWYIGIVGHHLTEPNEAFLSQSRLPLKLTAHAGANIPLGRKRLHNSLQSYIVPNIVYQQQGPASQLTAGLSFACTMDGREFIGAAVLRDLAKQSTDMVRIGLQPNGKRPAREGYSVYNSAGEQVGIVTSGSQSPTLNRPIAMAYVRRADASGLRQL